MNENMFMKLLLKDETLLLLFAIAVYINQINHLLNLSTLFPAVKATAS